MFENIRNLMASLAQPRGGEFPADDRRLAAAALMVHVADADGVTTPAERARLVSALSNGFGLSAEVAARLVDAGRRSDRESIDFHGFAMVLKRALDADGRLRIIEMMCEIGYADGVLHEFEDNIIARVAELLEVPEADAAAARRVAAGGRELP